MMHLRNRATGTSSVVQAVARRFMLVSAYIVIALSWCDDDSSRATVEAASLFRQSPLAVPLTSSRRSRRSRRQHSFIHLELRGGGGVLEEALLDATVNVATATAEGAARAMVTTPIDYTSFIDGAYSWCCNLGSPSALVAGAVVATLYENIHSGDLEIDEKRDSTWVQLGKKVARLLLLSAFMMETLSIYVTTVTGTMLLSQTVDQMALSHAEINTPLEFLKEHFEFEFLTARIMFLQGLLNWLAAIALGHILPSKSADDVDTPAEMALNRFIAFSFLTLIVLMISFYNSHATFYPNYWAILTRWVYVMMHGHVFGIGSWPPQPMSLLLIPSLLGCIYWAYYALWPMPKSTSSRSKPKHKRGFI